MHPRVARNRSLASLALAISLSACAPTGDQQANPEADPDFRRGQNLVSKLDHQGAVRAFERALRRNPDSAPAHLELAFIYKDHEPDAAGAIHHFRRYLELDSETDQAKVIRQHMDNCKMELAKQFLIAPVVPSVQKELDGLKNEIKRLQTENAELQSEVKRFRDIPPQLEPIPGESLDNPRPLPPLAPPPARFQARVPNPAPLPAPSNIPATVNGRFHEVRNGDYPAKIARSYGINVNAILRANPNIDPRKLKIGTRLRIPN